MGIVYTSSKLVSISCTELLLCLMRIFHVASRKVPAEFSSNSNGAKVCGEDAEASTTRRHEIAWDNCVESPLCQLVLPWSGCQDGPNTRSTIRPEQRMNTANFKVQNLAYWFANVRWAAQFMLQSERA